MNSKHVLEKLLEFFSDHPKVALASSGGTAGIVDKLVKDNILAVPEIRANTHDRCYLCKKGIFEMVRRAAEDDEFLTVIDGTNASDDEKERSGSKALSEMHILSPLRDVEITKVMVRRLSRKASLRT